MSDPDTTQEMMADSSYVLLSPLSSTASLGSQEDAEMLVWALICYFVLSIEPQFIHEGQSWSHQVFQLSNQLLRSVLPGVRRGGVGPSAATVGSERCRDIEDATNLVSG